MSIAYTVALCTHDHADRLSRTLADLRKLRAPEAPWELVIVDNACSDATPSLLAHEAWPIGWQVRVVREEKLGLSNARNCALREARGEYLIFVDDDETPDPEWLRAFERLISDRAPDAFGGRIEVLFDTEAARIDQRLKRAAVHETHRHGGHPVRHSLGHRLKRAAVAVECRAHLPSDWRAPDAKRPILEKEPKGARIAREPVHLGPQQRFHPLRGPR